MTDALLDWETGPSSSIDQGIDLLGEDKKSRKRVPYAILHRRE